jgi:hypothetical protein
VKPSAGDWNEVSRVVDQEKLSSRLNASESYLAELRIFRDTTAHLIWH